MANPLARYARQFDERQLRERALLAMTLLVALGFAWWTYHAEPLTQRLAALDTQNQKAAAANGETRRVVDEIRARITGGVHSEKQAELLRLQERLAVLERELRQRTVELIPPERMFALMNQLILGNSKLTLQRLARREVRSAIPLAEGAPEDEEAGIYRHVMEIELSGRFLDILAYLRAIEALDWKLLWDEIEISNGEYPRVDLRLVMSTLSTERQWVGI